MKKAEVRIVGSISDTDELDEIQSIVKIFVYERRIKSFTCAIKEDNSIRENYLKHNKKTDNCRKTVYYQLSTNMVRGLA